MKTEAEKRKYIQDVIDRADEDSAEYKVVSEFIDKNGRIPTYDEVAWDIIDELAQGVYIRTPDPYSSDLPWPRYNFRGAIAHSQELGRELTEDEWEEFRIDDNKEGK